MTNYAGLEQDGSATVLAARLRAARESRGLTQAQAASELGVSRPLLIAIEKGTRDPSSEEIVKLAEIYGRPSTASCCVPLRRLRLARGCARHLRPLRMMANCRLR